jgi:hypothetical protein
MGWNHLIGKVIMKSNKNTSAILLTFDTWVAPMQVALS